MAAAQAGQARVWKVTARRVTNAAGRRPLCVKVCGITRDDDAAAAIDAGADLLGFNFFPASNPVSPIGALY